jgi:hypothetical protein
MLEGFEFLQADHPIYRFANVVDFSDMLREMDLEAADVEAVLAFLGEIA